MTIKKQKMYIDGQFVTHQGDKWIEVLNPATEEIISRVPDAGVEDVRNAIDAAERAQDAWEDLPAQERGVRLHKIAAGIRAREQALTDIIIAEGGKTRALANTEVLFTADYLDYMAEWARRYEGEIVQSDRRDENIFVFKKAIGVTTGILPWNFPFFLVARKAAPALVTGRGSVVGNELASNPKVGMVSLTGSVSAGEQTMAAAAKNIIKVSLELGGKAPAIVMADADLTLAVKAIVASRVINTGQVCNCAERVYVQESIEDAFISRLTQAFKEVTFGNPAEQDALDMGPLIDEVSLKGVQEKVDRAVSQGATLVTGGKGAEGKGFFFQPTLLVDVRHEMDIMHEETFGPVLPVTTFSTLDEAVNMANDCEFGLTSSIYTTNLNTAMTAIKKLKFGETYINRENFEAMQGFHAGWRKSGIGGADGRHGLEEYLQTQVVYLQYQS